MLEIEILPDVDESEADVVPVSRPELLMVPEPSAVKVTTVPVAAFPRVMLPLLAVVVSVIIPLAGSTPEVEMLLLLVKTRLE